MRIFFASGQTYVALSRVRTLNDLVLWQFHSSAIYIEPFDQQLLQWCDNVDVIRPTPPTDLVEHPERNDDYLSNAPIPEPSDNVDEPKSGSIHFSVDHSTIPPDNPDRSSKWGKGRPRKTSCARQTDPDPKRGRGHQRKSEVTTSKSKPPAERGRGCPPKSNTSQPVISETVCISDNNQECSNRGIKRASGKRDDGQPPLKISIPSARPL